MPLYLNLTILQKVMRTLAIKKDLGDKKKSVVHAEKAVQRQNMNF